MAIILYKTTEGYEVKKDKILKGSSTWPLKLSRIRMGTVRENNFIKPIVRIFKE